MKHPPQKEAVGALIFSHMGRWSQTETSVEKRKVEFEALVESVINYFAIHYSTPTTTILPGLPGGKGLG